MVKILSRSGDSLADTYDVQGSIAGIETLESREVSLVHEMGGTLFSERVSGFIRRQVTGDIVQSTTFDFVNADLPNVPYRVLGVSVLASAANKTTQAAVSLRDPISGREIPIFVWDVANDKTSLVRIVENGAASGNFLALIPNQTLVPNMGIGSGQPQQVNELAFRGKSSAFGAGTVELTMLVYVAFSQIGGLSSRGLPLPGW